MRPLRLVWKLSDTSISSSLSLIPRWTRKDKMIGQDISYLMKTLSGIPERSCPSHFQMTGSARSRKASWNISCCSGLIWEADKVDPKETRTTPSGWESMNFFKSGGSSLPGLHWTPPISMVFCGKLTNLKSIIQHLSNISLLCFEYSNLRKF